MLIELIDLLPLVGLIPLFLLPIGDIVVQKALSYPQEIDPVKPTDLLPTYS
jgi:hypothetical protein